jgi:putative two-component system response regulator
MAERTQDLVARRMDGSEFPVGIQLAPVVIDSEVFTAAYVRDETRVRELTAAVAEAHVELIRRLAAAVDYRDRQTLGHIDRVALYAGAIARKMHEPDPELLELVCVMHDVGKVAIPDGILFKPGPLSESEMAVVKAHTEIGHAILNGTSAEPLATAARIALHHHERWDGSGYPCGKAGENIPLEARITSVADVFDAMTSNRPYRPAMPVDRVLTLVGEMRGAWFDPAVVDAFFAAVGEILAVRSTE